MRAHLLTRVVQGVKYFEFSYFDFDAVDENNRVRADPNPSPNRTPNPTAPPTHPHPRPQPQPHPQPQPYS